MTSPYRKEVDQVCHRYGIVWKLYDLVNKLRDDKKVSLAIDVGKGEFLNFRLHYPNSWRAV